MRTSLNILSKLIAYTWVFPNTALGILFGFVMLALGGKVRIVAGVAEFHGGWMGRFFATRPHPFCFGAITLGHVILGTCDAELCALRTHEHVHVKQYKRWGVFFLPAYALSSLWEISRGRDGYRNNYFERQAYKLEAKPTLQVSRSSETAGDAS